MLTKLRRAVCAVCAAAVMAAASVTAAADYIYDMDNNKLCDEIQADKKEVSGTQGTFETEFSDSTGEDFLSLRFRLFNEFADLDFWNDDNVSVSVEVKLETEGKDVIGCLPAFNTGWGWVNPSDYTELKYGEWVTVTETGKHFYEGFGKKKPAYIMFQVRTNWGSPAQGNVKLSVRNFTITTDGSATVVEPEQTTASSAAEDTTPSVSSAEQTAEPVTVTEEAKPTADASTAENAGTSDASTADAETKEAAVTNGGDDNSSTPAESSVNSENTSINIPEMEGEQPTNYSDFYKQESPVMMIVIIVGVAAVIVVAAIVGYIIYKKKKYY